MDPPLCARFQNQVDGRKVDSKQQDPGWEPVNWHNDSNTSISVVYGENLSAWSPAVHDGLNVIITETDDGYATGVDRVEVKISWDLVSGNEIFARLRVEISP